MSRAISRRDLLQTALLHTAAVSAAGVGLSRSLSAQERPGELPSQEEEPPAQPLPIVDTHQHLWDLKRFNLPWLANAPEAINRTFLVDDFQAATKGLPIVQTVYMEVDVHPAQQVQEAEFALELCTSDDSLVEGAVIGCTPHEKGFAGYLKRFEGEKRIKGMRCVLHGERPRGLCLQPAFVDAMKRLGEARLNFDLCLRPGELLDGVQLATQAPDTTFVLDHCGNIGAHSEAALRAVWCEGIKAAAAQPNIVCKVSGLIDKTTGLDRDIEPIAANIDFCLDAFGEDRVLFGGDWPVCLVGGSYRRWVEVLKSIVESRSASFRRKLFHDNAVKVYRLA